MSASLQAATQYLYSRLSSEKVRRWSARSTLSILDQGLTSGAGFAANLLLARWLSSESYGAFSVAFASLLFLFGYHSVLILEPMSVVGPANYAGEMSGYLAGQLKIHAIVVTALAAVAAAAGAISIAFGAPAELGRAIVACAAVIPFLFLLWLARRMCYVVQRPGIAVYASLLYLALVLAGLFALHATEHLSAATALLTLALAGALASVPVLWQLGLGRPGWSPACPCARIARENWTYGRWLVVSTTLFSVTSQAQTYIVAGMLGLGAAGVLRAAQVPSQFMVQIVTATALLFLPLMSYDFGASRLASLRRKALRASLILTVLAVAYACLLAAFHGPVEKLLYGGKFASDAMLIAVLALVPVCTGFALGFSMALRASQKPYFDLFSNALAAPVALLSAFVFIRWWGVAGAAWSMVAGFAVYAASYFWWFRRCDLAAGPAKTELSRDAALRGEKQWIRSESRW
jgi:O-antigen/teichoic acid export membrane protein